MEDLSPIVATEHLSLEIPVRACLKDHCFKGRVVLPAVEAMEVLARAAERFRPEICLNDMAGLQFDKFLPIASDADRLPAFCDLFLLENGDVKAVLATRTAAKTAVLARVKAHAAAVFHREGSARTESAPTPACASETDCLSISSARIYPELIPFGPFYRNVIELRAGLRSAVAEISTPVEGGVAGSAYRLGSPFALDAAFHAACVWGQRFAGIVAFPVAMDRRRIYLPTRAGEKYWVHVTPVRTDSGGLVFDLQIYDYEGRLSETCSGVRMRDVSGGTLTPPRWIRPAGDDPELGPGMRKEGAHG